MNHQALNNPITEDDIANYLANTPDFFVRHTELLATVQFTSPHSNRTVGLQERQAEMLREKIKALEQRIMEMVRHGSENVMLSDKVLRWARSLLMNTDLHALPTSIEQDIQNQFAVPLVGIRLWGAAPEFAALAVRDRIDRALRAFVIAPRRRQLGATGLDVDGAFLRPEHWL